VSGARKALVFGASGYVGSSLVPELQARGYSVRAASRSLASLDRRGWSGVDCVAADALEYETLGPALAGVDVAFYLVHSMDAGKAFGHVDLACAGNFARAAAEAGVKRIVYLGGLIPDEARSEHLRSRKETGDRLREGSVPVTEIRAGIIVGPGSAAFEIIRDLVNHLPVMLTPRWVRSRTPPIALENLLNYLVAVADKPEAAGRVYDAAGPEMLSYESLMRIFAEVVGRRPRIIPVPVLTPALSSWWLGLVTAVPTAVARALIGGLKHDIAADDRALRELVPQRLLGFREAVSRSLDAERRGAVASRWTEGAFMFRDYRQDLSWYARKAEGEAITRAPVEEVWRQVTAIGGENRYYFLNFLWTIRETLDWLVGGPGLARGRRHPVDVRVGDSIDSWQVVGVEECRRLTLQFGMKAPGAGALEFELDPVPEGVRIKATAYFHPAGFPGLLYWWSLFLPHLVIFDGLTSAIARRAEAADARRLASA
jgi:uncharacterized protein YbjT (DUF2867 family)